MILRRAVLLVAGLSLAFSVAPAQEPPQDPPPEAPRAAEPVVTPETEAEPPAPETEPEAPETEPAAPETEPETDAVIEAPAERPRLNPCKVQSPADEAPLDRYRREIFEAVCGAAAGFDGFFGSRRFDEEARRTHGRAGLQVVWDEEGGLELDGRLRVDVDFPNLDHRVNAFLGREERDAFLVGNEENLDFLPTFFGREGGEEWLIGLGYRRVGRDRSKLDFDVGVDVDSSIDPFLRARYRHYWMVGDRNLLRARQTVYWSDDKGVGSGTRLDLERPIGARALARWSANLVFDDETQGGDWSTGVTLYHGFSPDHAIAWFVGIDGETGREVPIADYGSRLTYRQRMLREWFFGELIAGVTWPKDDPLESRERAYHVGFGFEIQFSGEDLGIGRRP